MANKNDVEVYINGKPITLSGDESEEYIQKVASYINGKLNEFKKNEAFNEMTTERQAILVEINIADDYFKAKAKIDELETELQNKDKELYDLKHDLISAQMKNGNKKR
ncbi:MAG: cell division protein ZapA [Lachnospiraceae bacterium]|nr:cell division protein ZapA [Lachnospiraceae bacterium]